MTVINGSQCLLAGGLRLPNVSWNLLVVWAKAINGLISFGSARSVVRFLAFHLSLLFSRLQCFAWAGQKIRYVQLFLFLWGSEGMLGWVIS